jgi:pantothenate kinase-related protein Tda10
MENLVLKHLEPLYDAYKLDQRAAYNPFCIAIQGAQGSGKTTLAKHLQDHLETNLSNGHAPLVLILSLDDFYYVEPQSIQGTKRGNPGTHDMHLFQNTVKSLGITASSCPTPTFPIKIPMYNKSTLTRTLKEIHRIPDIVIIEGWCIGFISVKGTFEYLPQPYMDLLRSVNSELYMNYDSIWKMLRINMFVVLYPQSPSWVLSWRLEQEDKSNPGLDPDQIKLLVDRCLPVYLYWTQRTRLLEYLLVDLQCTQPCSVLLVKQNQYRLPDNCISDPRELGAFRFPWE